MVDTASVGRVTASRSSEWSTNHPAGRSASSSPILCSSFAAACSARSVRLLSRSSGVEQGRHGVAGRARGRPAGRVDGVARSVRGRSSPGRPVRAPATVNVSATLSYRQYRHADLAPERSSRSPALALAGRTMTTCAATSPHFEGSSRWPRRKRSKPPPVSTCARSAACRRPRPPPTPRSNAPCSPSRRHRPSCCVSSRPASNRRPLCRRCAVSRWPRPQPIAELTSGRSSLARTLGDLRDFVEPRVGFFELGGELQQQRLVAGPGHEVGADR